MERAIELAGRPREVAEFEHDGGLFDALPDEISNMSAFTYDVDWLRRELGLD